MPSRKLSLQDVEDLKIAWTELINIAAPRPKMIERHDVDGRPIILRIGKDLARWKNISEARFNELKAGGFVLRRGLPQSPPAETVSLDSYRTMFDFLSARIAALEADNAELRRQLKEKR